MRSLSGVKAFFILVRPKRDTSAKERIVREILSSPAFDKIKQILGEEGYQHFVQTKIVPIEGDITKENIGMRPEVYRMVVE